MATSTDLESKRLGRTLLSEAVLVVCIGALKQGEMFLQECSQYVNTAYSANLVSLFYAANMLVRIATVLGSGSTLVPLVIMEIRSRPVQCPLPSESAADSLLGNHIAR